LPKIISASVTAALAWSGAAWTSTYPTSCPARAALSRSFCAETNPATATIILMQGLEIGFNRRHYNLERAVTTSAPPARIVTQHGASVGLDRQEAMAVAPPEALPEVGRRSQATRDGRQPTGYVAAA